MYHRNVSRRDFLKGLAAFGIATPSILAGCGGFGLDEQGDTIRIAGLNSRASTLEGIALETKQGSLLAIEHAGEVLGRKLELVSFDIGDNVEKAVQVTKQALSDGIRFFFLGELTLPSVALAVSKQVDEGDGVLITAAGPDEVTGKDCRASTFRWSVPTYGAIRETVRPLVEADNSLTVWYAITPDTPFGKSLLRHAQQVLNEHEVELRGADNFHSVGEMDFTDQISKALAEGPQVLLLLNSGPQSSAALRKAVELGAKGSMKILVPWSGGLTQLSELGPDVVDGVYFGAQYWHAVDEPGNRRLVDLSQKKHERPPSYALASGYVGVRLIIDGITEAGSTDTDAVIDELIGHAYDGPTGPEHIRVEDNQVVKNYYLLQGKPANQMRGEYDLAQIVWQGKDNSAPPLEQIQCEMD